MSGTHLSPGMLAKIAALGLRPADVGRAWNDTAVEDITIPDSSAGLEEILQDPKRMKALLGKPGAFGEFITKYATVVLNKQQEISKQVEDQVEKTLSDFLKKQREESGAVPLNLDPQRPDPARLMGPDGRAHRWLYNPQAMGASIDKEFTNASEFFSLIWHNRQRDAQAQAKLTRVRNAFSSTVPSEGGFLIPENLRAELLRVALETAVVRPRARVIPMDTLRVPFPAIDDTSHVSSVYGGVVAYWTEEGAALTASQAAFGRIVLDAKKLTAYTEVPNELIADSLISFQAFLDQIFPEALGFYEDLAFIKGTGVGEPLGAINGPGRIAVTRAPASTVKFADIVNMFTRLLPGSYSRSVWLCSPAVVAQLMQLAFTVAAGDSISPPLWLTGGQLIEGTPLQILGRPLIVSEKVPNLGSTADIALIDFGFYLLGDRQVMSAMSSPHFKFQNDQTAYRIIERVDGQPWLRTPVTPQNNGPTLSPYVVLAA